MRVYTSLDKDFIENIKFFRIQIDKFVEAQFQDIISIRIDKDRLFINFYDIFDNSKKVFFRDGEIHKWEIKTKNGDDYSYPSIKLIPFQIQPEEDFNNIWSGIL